MNAKPRRNDLCPCGSGKKFKKCCRQEGLDAPSAQPGTVTRAELGQLVAMRDSGRYDLLERKARELIDRHPDSGTIWNILGAALQLQGKDALQALARAASLLPDDANAH